MTALAIWAGLMGLSALHGWDCDHLITEWSRQVACIMFVGALLVAVFAPAADLVLAAGVLLLLPALWASNVAHHVVLALPVLLEGLERR